MGIAGLWPALKAASTKRSLATIALEDGFVANPDGTRGLRIGIDASIWIVHATNWVVNARDGGDKGENPELRTILFKCMKLMHYPFLPLFVFDGPFRPKVKRGKEVKRSPHWIVSGTQDILTALGIEWRTAPGEAEAELAYLNRIGVIDCVLTDDVDAFLFGAQTVMRNNTATLAFNQALGKDRDEATHTLIYTAERILSACQLSRGGLILVALLSGGDYDSGIDGAGIDVACSLARAGFGDNILATAQSYFSGQMSTGEFHRWLMQWRQDIRHELKTNSKGCLKTKKPALASKFPDNFPPLDVLEMYVRPVTSEFRPVHSVRSGMLVDTFPSSSQPITSTSYSPPPSPSKTLPSSQPFPSSSQPPSNAFSEARFASDEAAKSYFTTQIRLNFSLEPSLPGIAHICERFFEWGYRERLLHRFQTLVWPFSVARVLRRAAILVDKSAKDMGSVQSITKGLVKRYFASATSTPRSFNQHSIAHDTGDEMPLLQKITMERKHRSTDNTLEYRVFLDVEVFSALAEAGIEGTRHPPDTTGISDWEESETGAEEDEAQGKKDKDKNKLRLWMPACVLQVVAPELIEEWKAKEARRAERSKGKGRAKKTPVMTRSAEFGEAEELETEEENRGLPKKFKSGASRNSRVKATATTMAIVKQPFPMSLPPAADDNEVTEEGSIAHLQSTATSSAKGTDPFPLSPPMQPAISLIPHVAEGRSKSGAGFVDSVFKARKVVRNGVLAGKSAVKQDSNHSSSDDGIPAPSKADGKPRATEKNTAGKSRVAEVAALFADSDVIRDLVQRPIASRPATKALVAAKNKGRSTTKAESLRMKLQKDFTTMRRTDSTQSHSSTSTNASTSTAATTASDTTANITHTLVSHSDSKSVSTFADKVCPQPFPMTFDLGTDRHRDDGDDSDAEVEWNEHFSSNQQIEETAVKGKERTHGHESSIRPSSRTSDRKRQVVMQKNPLRNVDRASPRKATAHAHSLAKAENYARTLDDFCSSDGDMDSDDERTSPYLQLIQHTHLRAKGVQTGRKREVIVISSDDDERPARPNQSCRTKRLPDSHEIIEISD